MTNNSNNDNNDNIYDISLNDKTIEQLYSIADENGASLLSGLNKEQALDAVKLILKRKKETIQLQEYQKNVNSFNKQIELTIKDGIDPLELLFWKIFRNKFIFRQIMSNMSSHLTIPYHSNNNVSYMIKHKLYGLLRDKVITNQFLSFKSTGNPFEDDNTDGIEQTGIENISPPSIYKVFNHFKSNTNEDSLFYKQLFQNYHNNIPRIGIQNKTIGFEDLVNKMIVSRCLVALKEFELLEIGGNKVYTPSQLNLEFAIGQGALKFIDYLLQPQFKLNVDLSRISLMIVKNPSKLFKSLNHLCNKHSIIIKSTEINGLINKILNYRKKKESTTGQNDLFDRNYLRHISVRSLITITRFILNIQNSTCSNDDDNNITLQIKEIESFKNNLSLEQLKCKLVDKCNQFEPNKSIIKKSLELYYSFIKCNEMEPFYHLYFGEDNENRVNLLNYDDCDSFRAAFIFGDFKLFGNNLLEKLESGAVEFTISNDINSDDSLYNIFSHCTNKDKLFDFINSIIQFIKSQVNCENLGIGPIFIWYLIIEYDDLELIKYSSNQFGIYLTDPNLIYNGDDNTLLLKSHRVSHGITRHIKSVEVLNWLYQNHKIHFKPGCWWYFPKLQLLKQYEILYCNDQGGIDYVINNNDLQFTQKNPLNVSGLEDYDSMEVLEYTICKSDLKLYKFIDYIGVINLISNNFTLLKSFYLNYIQYHSTTSVPITSLGEQDEHIITDCLNQFEFIKFLDWLYENYQFEFENPNGILNGPLQFKQTLLFSISRYLTLDFNQSNISRWKIFEFGIPELIDLSIDQLLLSNNIGDNDNGIIESNLFKFILKSIECGNLKSIEYINTKYTLKKTQSNNGLLGNDSLKKLIFKSLQLGLVQITNYLFDIIPISNDEFNKYSNKQYFKIV